MSQKSSTVHVEQELGDFRYVVEKRSNGRVDSFRELTDGSKLSAAGPEHVSPADLPTDFLRHEYHNLMTPGSTGS